MESTQELKHYGIKGQKWGIRRYENPDGTLTEAGKKRYRYQNPDGSLTEEGKKDYMTAAKKGKLDVSKLSDNDLNMINSRFARENTYKQNIQKYEDSKFSNQLKKAVIDRVKGSGGGGGGKGKSKGGVASLLAMPIKKAFEDAFKEDSKSGGGNSDKENQNPKPKAEEDDEALRGFKLGRHFARYGYKESDELRESRIKNGKRFIEGSLPLSMGPNRTAEDVIRDRRTSGVVGKNDEWWKKRKDDPDSWGWSSMRFDTSECLVHGASQYIVARSDECYHHGIKGQKWGVRRFENNDGTLTPEGKARYGAAKTFDQNVKKGKFTDDPEIRAIYIMEAEDKAHHGILTPEGKEQYQSYADRAKKEIGNASRDPRTSMGINIATSKKRIFGGKEAKKYRELDAVVSKASQKLGVKYGSKPTKENAKAFADAVASSGLQYIMENFPESKQDEAKAFVYATFVQMQDKAIRKEFGPINN